MRVLFMGLTLLLLVSFKPSFYQSDVQLLFVTIPKSAVSDEDLIKEIRLVAEGYNGDVSFYQCLHSNFEFKFIFNAQVGTSYHPQNLTSLTEKLKKKYPSCNTKFIPLVEKDNFCQISN